MQVMLAATNFAVLAKGAASLDEPIWRLCLIRLTQFNMACFTEPVCQRQGIKQKPMLGLWHAQ